MKFKSTIAITSILSAFAFVFSNAADTQKSDYIIVVSQATKNDAAWSRVVDRLLEKHQNLGAKAVVYEKTLDETTTELKPVMPRFVCFVAKPEESSRDYVAQIHKLTRKLDDDVYTDVFWGIITGYDAAAALRIADQEQPLLIRRAAASVSISLGNYDSGVHWNDSVKNQLVTKNEGDKEAVESKGPDDPTEQMVDMFNSDAPDLWITSGHASERDWIIGYNFPAGKFVHKDGILIGQTLAGKKLPINSPNPKVYMAVGNCLMGHVDRADCMATSYMNSAGVVQMLGYTKDTWFGFGGWGVNEYFLDQPGRYTFTEAFFANQAALDWCITEYMKANPEFKPETQARLTQANRDIMGLLYDQYIVAFYGDPAWKAELMNAYKGWEQELKTEPVEGNAERIRLTFTVTPNNVTNAKASSGESAPWKSPRPILQWFPNRFSNVKLIEGAESNPVITDNFLLVPRTAEVQPLRIVCEADKPL